MNNKTTFQANPVGMNISRSKFDLSHAWSGTFSAGECIPCFAYSDVYPGDTFKVGANIVIRSTTPIAPTMDQLYCDIYYFFVPHKMVLGRESMSTATTDGIHSFEAFIGAQDSLLNMPLPSNAQLPKVIIDSGLPHQEVLHSFADYIGVIGDGLSDKMYGDIHLTPFEALSYAKVWNDYFRDPNTMNPITYSISGGFVKFYGGSNNLNGLTIINDSSAGYNLLQPVCRYHGYFGSALPWPQRNSTAVSLPLGISAPVVGASSMHDTVNPVQFGSTRSGGFIGALGSGSDSSNLLYSGTWSGSSSNTIKGTNLEVDLQNATAASVNALRLSIATQRWYEALARSGNRLQNITGLFNVTPHDLTSDVPEYLGGKHFELRIEQVANTAGTTYSTATQQSIGSTGAYSLTNDGGYMFTKSFDTWGTIISIICIRPHESFTQGIHKRFKRFDRMQYYWPQMANIGEMPISNSEVFANGSPNDDGVFGYTEAWNELRMLPDIVTSDLRPTASMGYWTYANNFASCPSLAGYLNGKELYKNVDQTLQVKKSAAGFQFSVQVNHVIDAIRPIPTYSIPGFMDHN